MSNRICLLGNRMGALVLLLSLVLSGCATTSDATYTTAGAALGGGAGAALGADSGPLGTILGAGLGALGGGLAGSWFRGNQKKMAQTEYNRGYDRGQSDAIKRQYWLAQRLQQGTDKRERYETSYYTIPVNPKSNDPVKTVPYEVTVPILEPR